jgi:hypothetical protein
MLILSFLGPIAAPTILGQDETIATVVTPGLVIATNAPGVVPVPLAAVTKPLGDVRLLAGLVASGMMTSWMILPLLRVQ